MAANTIFGYIQWLLGGEEFTQTAYAWGPKGELDDGNIKSQ